MVPLEPTGPISVIGIVSMIAGLLAFPVCSALWFNAVNTFDRRGREGSLFFLGGVWVLGLTALVLGIIHIVRQGRRFHRGGGMAATGVILGGIALLGALIVTGILASK